MTLFPDDLLTTQERVEKELELVREQFYSFYLVSAGPVNEDMYHWRATIRGPPNTPYERGFFLLNIRFGGSYPLVPPRVCFETKIFHPNVSHSGAIICEKLLMTCHWHRMTRMKEVFLKIYELLIEPDIDSVMNPEVENAFPGQQAIAGMYVNQRGLYDEQARICTENYARWD